MQTTDAIASQFREEEVAGFQEEVQLREQDFGNFQARAAPIACSDSILPSKSHVLLCTVTARLRRTRSLARCLDRSFFRRHRRESQHKSGVALVQDAEGKQREKAERLRFGRFFYRFPNGESGADVYDRMTIFEVWHADWTYVTLAGSHVTTTCHSATSIQGCRFRDVLLGGWRTGRGRRRSA